MHGCPPFDAVIVHGIAAQDLGCRAAARANLSIMERHRSAAAQHRERVAAATRADPRWAAVVARDRTVDGAFVYSVATTGVYCRPSCPSRQARAEHVRFHATPMAAAQAGFRACRRCAPDQPVAATTHTALVTRLCRMIADAETPPSLAALAAAVGVSRFHLHRIFTTTTGLTPHAYAKALCAQRLGTTLRNAPSVTSAVFAAGFAASSRFYDAANAHLGMTPSTFRAGGKGLHIHFAVSTCALGAILVAATTRGICAILLDDSADALVQDLHARFPQATVTAAGRDFHRHVARVIRFVEAPQRGLDLPLAVQGTVFQHRVWQALRAIPAGTTTTYSELARSLGIPAAVRAVASACAANPVAVAIPCHRVLRRDGSLAGYRWGIARKRQLLATEAHPGAAPPRRG